MSSPIVFAVKDAAKGIVIGMEHQSVRSLTHPRGRKRDYQASMWTELFQKVNDGDVDFSEDYQGRVHSPFTRIPRTTRQHALRFNDRPLVEVDVSACQPLHLGYSGALDSTGDLPVETQGRFVGKSSWECNRQLRRVYRDRELNLTGGD